MLSTADAAYLASAVTRKRDHNPVRILHYPCGNGEALERLSLPIRPSTTYGADPHLPPQAATRVDHPCMARLDEMRIGEGAFQLVLITLPPAEPADRVHRTLDKAASAAAEDACIIVVSRTPAPRELLQSISRTIPVSPYDIHAFLLPSGATAIAMRRSRRARRTPNSTLQQLQQLAQRPSPMGSAPKLILPTARSAESSSPIFAPAWLSDEKAAEIASLHGPWASATPSEYLDEDPATESLQPLMPLRKGHLALLVASGALGVIPVTIRGRRALLLGRTLRNVTEVETEDENSTVTRESLTPTLSLLFPDSGEIIHLSE